MNIEFTGQYDVNILIVLAWRQQEFAWRQIAAIAFLQQVLNVIAEDQAIARHLASVLQHLEASDHEGPVEKTGLRSVAIVGFKSEFFFPSNGELHSNREIAKKSSG